MKRNLFLLIAFIMLISQNALLAALPVTPSTDTGAGATWYRIKNLRAADGGKAAYMKAEAYNQAVIMADIDDADNFLWCFVGNETDGFQIYNKAFLENGARLISVEGGNGTAQLAPTDTEWNHSWLIKDDNGLYGLLPGTATNDNYLHGTLDIGIIFYGHTATEGGCAWIFEDASQEIVVDFSALIALIEEYTIKVNNDKSNPATAEKYAEGISAFEAAIAIAQAVVDDPSSTQSNVSAALNNLKKASYQYSLALIDLPFTISTDDNMVWYKVKNVRRAAEGYLTNDGTGVITAAKEESDNQLWAFTGNNITGVNIYNKANMENGAKMIYSDGKFVVSSSSWDGAWKIDRRIDDGSFFYGICNANGSYDNDYKINDFMHGMLDGNLVFYGFGDFGSLYEFEKYGTDAVEGISANDVLVYAANGMVFVKGSDTQAKIISVSGQTDVFNADEPYTVSAKGIYIVQVEGKAYKVAVQ